MQGYRITMYIEQKSPARRTFLLFLTYEAKLLYLAGCLHYASHRNLLSGYVNILQQFG